MKKIYNISRIVLACITLLLFSIMLINEDSSWFFVPILFSFIVYILSFPSTIFAKKIIKIQNKFDNIFFKILYYIVLLIALVGICFAFYTGILYISDNFINDLGQALLTLFVVAVIVIVVILPYIQAIIINILKKIIR